MKEKKLKKKKLPETRTQMEPISTDKEEAGKAGSPQPNSCCPANKWQSMLQDKRQGEKVS